MATANKELVRHFYEEVWNRGNTEVALEVFADDYVRHDLRPTESIPGGAGQAKIAADFRTAFPDLVFRPELIIAEGDLVAARQRQERTEVAGAPLTPPASMSSSSA